MANKIRPERWKRAEELFGEALEHPEEERGAFLDRLSISDPTLRLEVERLLAADGEANRFLAGTAFEGAARLDQRGRSRSPARPSIGPYRLLRRIGEGGMSEVWLAVRADREVRRRVAVKCLRHSMATADLRRRLRREGQILASLDHPHIARLYDAGTTDDGLPYFVMEYIEGEPITGDCDQRRLGIEERLELFRAVCSAVHYAHQNLIVHRDIKPTNILVRDDGTPKLLDFGVAKWLNPELTSRQLAATLPWQQFLTPEYASPEQIRGQRVTTASDVYSLGVLLFELLSGQRPHGLTGRSPQEIMRISAEEEPAAPSAAVAAAADPPSVSRFRRLEPTQLRRRLEGDLDNIVARALDKVPRERYGSAEQLAEDVRRHLVGLPVLARRPTFGYRAGRFLRRNRVAMGVAAAFAALLLAAAVVLGLLSIRLAEERDAARSEQEKAIQVADFLKRIFELTGPDMAKQNATAREILDRGAQRLSELEDQPELQATLMSTVGGVYLKLGLYAEAERYLESALEIQRRVFEPPHPDIAETLASLSQVQVVTGDPVSAEALLREALAVRRAVRGDEHPEVATALRDLGGVLEEQGRYDEAEILCRRALEMHRRSLHPGHPALTDTIMRLARVLFSQARYAEAETLHREALALRRTLPGHDPLAVAESLNGLALVLQAKGDYDESERLLGEALAINRQRLGEYHMNVAANLNNLASVATYRKDFEKAGSLYREVLNRLRVMVGEEHPNLAFVLLGLGSAKFHLGDHQSAEKLFRQAFEIRSQHYPSGSHLIANAQVLLGRCLIRLGRFEEAEAALEAAFRVLSAHQPPRLREQTKNVRYLVELYEAWDRPEKAAEYHQILDGLPPLPDAE